MNKKFWATAFTLSGTLIGAGILGLPYVFAKSGYLIGLFWIFVLGILIAYVNLCMGEVTLRTKTKHQLPGYARKYLGKWGEQAMFFSMIFGIYAALLAYLVGEGESLSSILPGNINPIILGVLFWVVMTLMLREGMKALKKIESYGVIAICLIVVGIFVYFFPQLDSSNLVQVNYSNFFLPIGVVMFAFLGFSSIPELRDEIRGEEKLLGKAIMVGYIIPAILYLMFSVVFVGVLGSAVGDVATISFGPYMTLLGIFTMLTSFFVLSYALRDAYLYDLKSSQSSTFFWASFVPLVLYILIEWFNLAGFAKIISIGGTVSGGLTGIMILLVALKAKATKTKSEINMPINWFILTILSIIFIAGIVSEFL